MSAAEIVKELEGLASPGIKKVLLKHGIPEPVLGVRVEALKQIRKRIRSDYQLALELYATGIYDAMYLAGLIADEQRMTKKDLKTWVRLATCHALAGSTVAWVAAESRYGWELALEWIASRREHVAVAGWSTLSSLVGLRDDSDLDLVALQGLLDRGERQIHQAPNRVRYAMNGFVIAVGTAVRPLSAQALRSATEIGVVSVDFGETDCKVPYAPDYIRRVEQRGAIGKKRKTARC